MNKRSEFLGKTVTKAPYFLPRIYQADWLTFEYTSLLGKPTFSLVKLMTYMASLYAFLIKIMVHEKLHATGNWLSTKVHESGNNNKYRNTKFLKFLKVVNDLPKRYVKDKQDYGHLAKDSTYRQDILFVVSDHCENLPGPMDTSIRIKLSFLVWICFACGLKVLTYSVL